MAFPTYYPRGFAADLVVRNMPLLQTHPGKVFWVYNGTTLDPGHKQGADGPAAGSGNSNTTTGTFNRPYATIQFAVNQCRAGKGDIIVVKPGHAEKVSAANALKLSTAGVAIVGMGSGTNRPKITLDTANTACIQVTANDVSIQNFQFVANFLSIATVFTLTTAQNFSLQNCSFTDTSSILTFLSIVTTDATANHADGLMVQSCNWYGSSNTTATAMVTIGAALANWTISDNFINLGIQNNGGACMTGAFIPTAGQVLRNNIIRLNTAMSVGLAMDTTAAPDNLVMDNRAQIGVDTITSAVWLTNAGAALSNNRSISSTLNTASMLETPVQDV